MMIENDLAEVEIVEGDSKIHLKRPGSSQQMMAHMPVMSPSVVLPVQQQAEQAAPNQDDELVDIKSQMVGTFYSAPSPDSDAYVKVGSSVEPDTVVCIIEAMKVMNEIKAEVSGTIAEIKVQNGQAIEYGQVIFKVKP